MSDVPTFPEWKLRHGPTSSQDPEGVSRALMESAWNGAVEEVAKWLVSYAARFDDPRRAAIEVAAENIGGYMRSPRLCSCCGQPIVGAA